MNTTLPVRLDDDDVEKIASHVALKLLGDGFDAALHALRLRMAMEHRIAGGETPYLLDRLDVHETAIVADLKVSSLQSVRYRESICFPAPILIGRKSYWLRSEVEGWCRAQRGGGLRQPRKQDAA